MPRIADRMALLGFKPTTRDRNKKQHRFDFEPDVLTLEKIRAAVRQLQMQSTAPIQDENFLNISPELEALATQMSTKLGMTLDEIIQEAMKGDPSFDPPF